jgi:hypothetical protein
MTSEAQIRANQQNALQSTGPSTARGKSMMWRNALKHGMTSARVVLFDESKADFKNFHAGLARDLAPDGTAECALVERIAILAWRLRRASRAEAALLNAEAKNRRERLAVKGPHPLFPVDVSMMFDRFIREMGALTHYEGSIDRQLNRAIAMLERLQAQRSRRKECEGDDRGHRAGSSSTGGAADLVNGKTEPFCPGESTTEAPDAG